jgi:gamma-glutamylcyclotransferase (GGCT)/AIG2-like uncharacterized protein YtfP
MKHLICVYGTLKKTYHNNRLLEGQTFVQDCVTAPHYRLYDCGWYPCLVEDNSKGYPVKGEIWQVDEGTLWNLDRLEGVPYLYQRKAINLSNFDQPVEAYFYQNGTNQFRELVSGEWKG